MHNTYLLLYTNSVLLAVDLVVDAHSERSQNILAVAA